MSSHSLGSTPAPGPTQSRSRRHRPAPAGYKGLRGERRDSAKPARPRQPALRAAPPPRNRKLLALRATPALERRHFGSQLGQLRRLGAGGANEGNIVGISQTLDGLGETGKA